MRIALVAGEPSGDYLGAGLIRALADRYPTAQFEGIGGPAMQAAGLRSHHPLEALSVMGLIEVLGHLPRLLAIRRDLRRRWISDPPDVFIGIDAPDFNLGLERALRAAGITTLHYVSPTVWAWRSGRISAIRAAVDRMLCIFPFEPDFLAAAGIDARFVGHPLADAIAPQPDPHGARAALGLAVTESAVAILPGSRRGEVNRLLPSFLDAGRQLLAESPDRRLIVPAATPGLRPLIESLIAKAGLTRWVTVVDGQARTVLTAADVGLIASGTATLEAMLLGCPAVMAYRMNRITAMFVRRSLRIQTFAIPNLLAGEPLIPEFVQEQVQVEPLAEALRELLASPERRTSVIAQFATLHEQLRCNASERAADSVVELLTARASSR
jgi:lipid-A-disaccharide synthase